MPRMPAAGRRSMTDRARHDDDANMPPPAVATAEAEGTCSPTMADPDDTVYATKLPASTFPEPRTF